MNPKQSIDNDTNTYKACVRIINIMYSKLQMCSINNSIAELKCKGDTIYGIVRLIKRRYNSVMTGTEMKTRKLFSKVKLPHSNIGIKISICSVVFRPKYMGNRILGAIIHG